ncbi:hypothetical protein [Vibrio sp. WXL210]|uniref:hypothetical protein n=1 Tax=Vibrio sp. WXL210 TaxID=3450709 RepID=UPI003EC686D4
MLHPHFGTLHTKLLVALCISLILGLNAVYIDHLTHEHPHQNAHAHEHQAGEHKYLQYYLKRVDMGCDGHNHPIQYDDFHDHHNCELVNCVKNIVSTCMPTLSLQTFTSAFQAMIKPSIIPSLPEFVARAPPAVRFISNNLTH